jgi:DNA-binding GntR family transcriptional regulator
MPAVIQLKQPLSPTNSLTLATDARSTVDLAPSQPTSRALSPKALYLEVAELLRQRIFQRTAGDLEPGSWIDELKLAEEYGISRTPLREALKVLATEGLVTMKVRRGAYVTEVSEQDLTDVYHLLSLLESDAAGVVASTATDAQMTELGKLHEALEATVPENTNSIINTQLVDTERFFSVNEQFHMRLLAIANNRWRDQMVADLRKVMKLNRHNSLLKTGRIAESLDEHRAIMSALYARDAAATVAAMKAHFKNGLEAAG